MTTAAPEALAGVAKYGVSVGMSLSSWPSAPGAPLGQSGVGSAASVVITKRKTPVEGTKGFINARQLYQRSETLSGIYLGNGEPKQLLETQSQAGSVSKI